MDHFTHPRNVGEIPDASGVGGEVGNAKCGDIMKMYLKIKDDRIEDVKLKALDAVVDGLDAIPCALAHNAVLRQAEDPLEGADGGGGVRAEDAVGLGDSGMAG